MTEDERLARHALARLSTHIDVNTLVVSSQPFGKLQHDNTRSAIGEIYQRSSPEWQRDNAGLR